MELSNTTSFIVNDVVNDIIETIQEVESLPVSKTENIGSSRRIRVVKNGVHVSEYDTFFSAINAVNFSETLVRKAIRNNTEIFGHKFSYIDSSIPNEDSMIKEVYSKDYKIVKGFLISECGLVKVKSGKWTPGRKDRGARRIDIDGKKDYVHLVMARSFLGNGDHFHVEHIDGDKMNNMLSNIHYVTKSETRKKAIKNANGFHPRMKTVVQKDIDGSVIATFNSMVDASVALKCSVAAVSKCCNGNSKTCKGFKLSFD